MLHIQEINNSIRNQIQEKDKSFHSWYQFVLGFPPHLVRYYIMKFGIKPGSLVADPFCGTGTTNVECKKMGIDSVGLEANPIAYFASKVKTNWSVAPQDVQLALRNVLSCAYRSFQNFRLEESADLFVQSENGTAIREEPKLSEDQAKVLVKGSISERPLRKILTLRECIKRIEQKEVRDLLLLALGNLTVNHAGNVAFGPEIYTTKPKKDFDVLECFYRLVDGMAQDLDRKPLPYGTVHIAEGDARAVSRSFDDKRGFDFVITSPPYPNEKDYTRTTRLESVVLELIGGKKDLRLLKENLLRSNSRNVFVGDDDDRFSVDFESVTTIADSIEKKRIALGKTSGFERLYHKIVRHYFGGMYRHLQSLKPFLSPGCRLAYVVGDQMSFFQTHIPTARILAEISQRLGYHVDEIELWRTRLATATKTQVDENVLVLST